MSEIKLPRCPFCGGEAELLKGQCEIDNYVMCLECRSKTKLYNTKASAIKAWNTRKPMQNIVERLEEKSDFHVKLANYEMNVGTIVEMEKHKMAIDVYSKAIEILKEEGELNGSSRM